MVNESSGVFLAPGAAVGPYRIASVPCPGVYEAVDPVTQRRVALRPLAVGAAAAERLRAAAQFRHPQVVPVLSVDSHGGQSFLVSEFPSGTSLADHLTSRGRLPWRDATRVAADVCRGLAALHAAGFPHGDLKPGSVVRDGAGVVRVADFGLGQTPSPHYAAPERHAGLPANPRADLYSLGATYFALLTGRPPYHRATTPAEAARAHNHEPTPAVRAGMAELPLRCDSVIQRAMAKNPADRYADAGEMLADLTALAAADVSAPPLPPIPPLRAVRPSWRERLLTGGLLLGLLAAAGTGGYAVFLRKDPPKETAPKEDPATALSKMTNSVGMALVRVPAGEFLMGDLLRGDARPHRVLLPRGYWVGVHEVTQRQYQLVTGTNPSIYQGDSYPVENVSWADAVEFCKKLSQREEEARAGRTYRLPTEAEWEFACRAGTRTTFAHGPTLSAQTANTLLGGLGRTAAAGTYAPNGWGLYDTHGNVWEWCADWYAVEYYALSPGVEPQGPESGRVRVARGGAYSSPPEQCTSGYRHDAFSPDHKAADLGFRVMCVTDRASQ